MSVTESRQFVGFRTSEEDVERLRELAAQEDRSVASILRRLVNDHLEQTFTRSKS